jgi:large subunit ribosomal protein L4
MAVATYTKAGAKASAPAKLDKAVFGLEVKNHQLIKDAYLAYLANGRVNNAVTKKRGEVRGGGRKPWRQKGTGNARFGSSRNPIWRGGGVAFGPTGSENYTRKMNTSAKRQALRQALSLAAKEDRVKVIESIAFADGKSQAAVKLLKKLDAAGSILIVAAAKDQSLDRATRNLEGVKLVQANYLNVYDITNANVIIMEKLALEAVGSWLGHSASSGPGVGKY